MYKQTGSSFDLDDHDLGFPETPRNLTTNLSQSLSMDQDLPYNPLLIHNINPTDNHVQESSGPATAPLFMELFGSYRSNSSVASATRNNYSFVISSLFGGDINIGDQYGNVHFENSNNNNILNGVLLDFTMEDLGGGFTGGLLNNGGVNSRVNPFATERQRRMQMSGKYAALRDLIPNPTKMDRASVVGDAIEYIKELTRTVQELKLLVERKRYCTTRAHLHSDDHIRIKKNKIDHRRRQEETSISTMDGSYDTKPLAKVSDQDDHDHRSYLRSSWLQRKSKDTEVDVRIIDDEVTVKLVQRKKINLLLLASELLEQLRLDIRHIAGGCVGDSYSFLFNTKICEGSSLYASAIANKLIEVLDMHYATISL